MSGTQPNLFVFRMRQSYHYSRASGTKRLSDLNDDYFEAAGAAVEAAVAVGAAVELAVGAAEATEADATEAEAEAEATVGAGVSVEQATNARAKQMRVVVFMPLALPQVNLGIYSVGCKLTSGADRIRTGVSVHPHPGLGSPGSRACNTALSPQP